MQTHDPDEDVYLPRLRWTNPVMQGKTEQPAELAVLRLNRDQTRIDVLLCNSRSTVSYSDLTSGYWAQHYYGARRMA